MKALKSRIYQILSNPPEGDRFGKTIHIGILLLITANVSIGMVETVPSYRKAYASFFYWFEFISVVIFSIEYVLRIWSCTAVPKYEGFFRGRWKQMTSPMSIVDLLAILPFYLQMLVPGLDLRFVRVLRLLRLFRLFRFGRIATAFRTLGRVIHNKKEELFISLLVMLLVLIVSSNLMYLAEHNVKNTPFTSVPATMWWGMITITTIGYGDMVPVTTMGRAIGMVVAFLGVCVFALPVAILGSGFMEELERKEKLKHTVEEEFEAERVAESLKHHDISVLPQVQLTEQQVEQIASIVAQKLAEEMHKKA